MKFVGSIPVLRAGVIALSVEGCGVVDSEQVLHQVVVLHFLGIVLELVRLSMPRVSIAHLAISRLWDVPAFTHRNKSHNQKNSTDWLSIGNRFSNDDSYFVDVARRNSRNGPQTVRGPVVPSILSYQTATTHRHPITAKAMSPSLPRPCPLQDSQPAFTSNVYKGRRNRPSNLPITLAHQH